MTNQVTVQVRCLSFQERLRRVFCHEVWNIGIVDQTAEDLAAQGIVKTVRWLGKPAGGLCLADPACLVQSDGRRTLFAEALRMRSGRGSIWYAELDPGQHPSEAQFKPLLQRQVHLSYPFPFRDDAGRPMLTMESWQAGHSPLLSEDDGVWRDVGRLLDGRAVVDPTLWRGNDRWWLFCTFQDTGPDNCLYIFHAATLGHPWIAHLMNPVKQDFASARSAGPLFMAGDRLIRPAQDSHATYGGAVVLNVVERLDEHNFLERPLRRVPPVAGLYQWGLHTLCPAGDVTLIDGKTWRFDAVEFAGRLLRRLSRSVGRISDRINLKSRSWHALF